MKRKYIIPQTEFVAFEMDTMLATSLPTGVDRNEDDAHVGGEGDDALSNHSNSWKEQLWDDQLWDD